ncbi:MAG TPA: response regulator [Syntrophomonadaceae bacterium]|nr:response regulator [Syntrophomonadaceae bacterium]
MGRDTLKEKVLIVDDDPLVTKIIKDTLDKADFETAVLHDPSQALDVAKSFRPDIILVDRIMPTMDGCELCRQFRNNHYTAHLPILMLTSRTDTADKIAGFEAGADDYLCKPFEPLELVARLRAHIRRINQERQTNPLTGLYGNPAVEKEIKERIRKGQKFSALYIDIDNFKAYNDTYGFLQGDEVIKFLAETLITVFQENGNPDDFLGHIGGDDFIAITTPDRAEKISSLLIQSFDRGIKKFYSKDDWERGFVLTIDRRGREQIFPLLSLSIAIVSNEHRKIDSHWLVSEIAAELKKYAKTFPGSIYVKDRREA